jgi:glycosyltransferase involved in cell wall biosynthesis
LPVIATNVGSNSEVIQNEVTGLVTSKDVESIVGAVQQFIAFPSLIKTLGEKGKEIASKQFTLENMNQAHLVLYRESGI